MSNEAPTDALRLVPIERIQFAIDAIAHLKPEKARFALEQMLAAAPASPLPGGGEEALIAELKEARGLLEETTDELKSEIDGRYDGMLPQLEVRYLRDMSTVNTARAFLARNGKGEGK